jgi:hypothetical protein
MPLRGFHENRLGDFELDVAGIDVPSHEARCDLILELDPVLELNAGHVHGKHFRRDPFGLPSLQLPTSLIEDPVAERLHHAGPFRDRNEGPRAQEPARLVTGEIQPKAAYQQPAPVLKITVWRALQRLVLVA